ncbi:hypothetical protein MNBD_GAMMA10-165 [hydrothermal vent metagenome]|uniref:Uncharacterized protein n=1 Tax=hydrothermal vent metagenome TaxID=652676 RepID=A0A3B0XUN2_9ZZZZ
MEVLYNIQYSQPLTALLRGLLINLGLYKGNVLSQCYIGTGGKGEPFGKAEVAILNEKAELWREQLILEKSVESQKSAQAPGPYSYMKKVFISSRSRASRH